MVRHIDPLNEKSLKIHYERLMSECDTFRNLTFDDFLEARNSVFVLENTKLHIYAIIGLKRKKFDFDLYVDGISDLPYHCTKNNDVMYEVEFIHINSNYQYDEEIAHILIETVLQDKRDAFTIIPLKNISCPEIVDLAINEAGFARCIDKKTNVQYYLRSPIKRTK